MSSFETAKATAQMLIRDEGQSGVLTREIIAGVVDRVLAMLGVSRGEIDRDRLVADLETDFSVWIGRETTLSDNQDHLAWLTAERKQGWAYWPRFRLFLEALWPAASIEALEDTTDRILGLLEDPWREGSGTGAVLWSGMCNLGKRPATQVLYVRQPMPVIRSSLCYRAYTIIYAARRSSA